MASPEPPIVVDWIAASVLDGHPGRLGLTFLPGKQGASLRHPGRVYRRELESDLVALAALGVSRLLLLVDDAELARWGDADIIARARAHRIEVERRPIPDGGVPTSRAEMESMLDWLDDGRETSDVAVACMGGVGRTGTVAACALVRAGWGPDDAIAEVRRIRHPTAVETDEQAAFVRGFVLDL